MTVKCLFCEDTKIEPGIPGPCVWCEEVEPVTLGTVTRYAESCGEGGGVVKHASGQFVEFKDYDAALAREAALREELDALRESYESMRDRKNSIVDLQQRLTVAEQRYDSLRSAAQRYLDFRHAGDCGQGYQFSGIHPQTELKAALKPAEEGEGS